MAKYWVRDVSLVFFIRSHYDLQIRRPHYFVMLIASLKHSAKISSILPIFCNIKTKCSQNLHQLAELLRKIRYTQLPFRYSCPLLIRIDLPLNGESLSRFSFIPNIDPLKSHEMEFGRKHFPPLRKIFWRKRKSSKNCHKINSSASNAETVQQNLSSDVDSGSMISSYRDVVANANKLQSEGNKLKFQFDLYFDF